MAQTKHEVLKKLKHFLPVARTIRRYLDRTRSQFCRIDKHLIYFYYPNTDPREEAGVKRRIALLFKGTRKEGDIGFKMKGNGTCFVIRTSRLTKEEVQFIASKCVLKGEEMNQIKKIERLHFGYLIGDYWNAMETLSKSLLKQG